MAARLQEAFAAFLEHTDAQIGRLVDALDQLGRLDNTLLLLLSDNGASQEGGPFGVMHEMKYFNFLVETPDEAVQRLDDIGGPHSHANYPWGWAQAGNTPFKWYKQNTHEGGVHVPLIVHWPGGIGEAGGLRDQFHHVNDLVPTIYDALGVEAPAVYRGCEQIPMAGVSLRYSFDDPAAAEPQGGPVLRDDGPPGHLPRRLEGGHPPPAGRPLRGRQVGALPPGRGSVRVHRPGRDQPERLAELIERWWAEAEEYGVLPLDDRSIELFSTRYRDRSPHPTDRRYSYFPPMSPLPAQVAPSLGGRGWDMSATIQRPAGAEGVLYSSGTENSGVSLFVQDDRLVFDYNCFGDHHVVVSEATVPTGDTVVGVEFRRSGQSGDVTLTVDGEPSGKLVVPFAMTMISSVGPSIGYDHGSPVSDRYTGHFPFEGVLHRLDVTLVRGGDGPRGDPAAEERSAMSRQ